MLTHFKHQPAQRGSCYIQTGEHPRSFQWDSTLAKAQPNVIWQRNILASQSSDRTSWLVFYCLTSTYPLLQWCYQFILLGVPSSMTQNYKSTAGIGSLNPKSIITVYGNSFSHTAPCMKVPVKTSYIFHINMVNFPPTGSNTCSVWQLFYQQDDS